ncbi:MAG: hypothetical protein AAFZ87_18280, partial [Planctomycetota bacterium]
GDPFPLEVGPANALVVTYEAELDINAAEAETFLNTATVGYDGVPGDPLDRGLLVADVREDLLGGGQDRLVGAFAPLWPFGVAEPIALLGLSGRFCGGFAHGSKLVETIRLIKG